LWLTGLLIIDHWSDYGGNTLLSYNFLDNWDSYLERMNENKIGKPYSFLLVIGYMHTYIYIYPIQTKTEGVIKATEKRLPDHPSYGHMCKRINRLRVDIKKEDGGEKVIIIMIMRSSYSR